MAGAAYGGFHPHLPGLWHRGLAKALGTSASPYPCPLGHGLMTRCGRSGATMFFFMFYRIRQDGKTVFLVRRLAPHPSSRPPGG